MSLNTPLTGNALLGSAGLFALVTALWDQIKLYWSKVWGLIFVKVHLHSDNSGLAAINRLFINEFKRTSFDCKTFSIYTEYVRPRQKNQLIAVQVIDKAPSLWWRNKRPIIISEGGIDLTFIRGMYNAEELLIEALEKYNAERSDKDYKANDNFFIRKMYGNLGKTKYEDRRIKDDNASKIEGMGATNSMRSDKYTSTPLQWKREELGQPKKKTAISDMSLTPEILELVQETIRWRQSEDWFKERGVPWKRGLLFGGGVGTGKTAFTRALGQELNMPIFSFDLTTMSNSCFSEAWNTAKCYSPCIVLIEDIDAVFDGRKNVACNGLEKGLSFDCLINSIDGVENSDGIFIIITTNDLSKIDPAIGGIVNGNGMSTRPGRIDKTIIFKPLDSDGREKMARRILKDFDISLWGHLLKEKHEDSGAQFQERCCKLALKLFWEKK